MIYKAQQTHVYISWYALYYQSLKMAYYEAWVVIGYYS